MAVREERLQVEPMALTCASRSCGAGTRCTSLSNDAARPGHTKCPQSGLATGLRRHSYKCPACPIAPRNRILDLSICARTSTPNLLPTTNHRIAIECKPPILSTQMASYLQKLRRQSKQLIPQTEKKFVETKVGEGSKAQDAPQVQEPATTTATATTTAGPSEPVQSPPAPTVTEPSNETAVEPVLDEEDQEFLERLTAIASEPEGEAPPLPTRPVQVTDDKGETRTGRDAQIALMDGADKVALPLSPPEVTAEGNEKGKEKAKGGLDRKKSVLSYFSIDRFKKGDKDKMPKDKTEKLSEKERSKMADDLLAAAAAAKVAEEEEQKKENKELTEILDQLNLSAVNNRVFSFSKESEELLNKFTQVLKDIINGAPHAYNDLEKLFTDYDAQLKKMYGGLPPFLQNMVKSLPAKLTATLGPELLAAGAEKPGFDAKAAGASSKSKKSKIPGIPTIPSLKSLVTAQGAVATALRSIVNFLKFRFPMLATGTNLIMSLAVFRKSLTLTLCT
jgi:hypothetical protein